ncbi:MAG: phosphate/phosphite/phosphonate ABC transporter substrate-binding protein [Desulfobacterales bacterium]
MFARSCRVIIVFVSILFLTLGCHSDKDVKLVDFAKTAAIERPGYHVNSDSTFRVAVASIFSPKETVVHYHQLLDYIAAKLDREIAFIQRKTYGEIDELLKDGKIDMGFICSGPYVKCRETYGLKAIVVPQVRGDYFYHSYLIVNKESAYKQLDDLRGKVFAFTDPESNTGKLVPTYWLAQKGENPQRFFSKTIYTYSHDNSIMAVAESLVDGAAVHGQIWDYYNHRNPAFTHKTRIIRKSEPFGNPPLVVSGKMPGHTREKIRKLLVSMHRDPAGKKILDELMIDRFIEPEEKWYDPIVEMKKKL